MTRAELINHLEHLAEYVKYSEDAPALREAIEILRCSEIPNSSKDFFWKNARKNARKYTETHACDLIKRQDAIDAVNSIENLDAKARGGICFKLMGLPPAQRDHIAEVSKKVDSDLISRQAAIDAIDAILPVEPMKNEYTQGITCGAALAIEYVKQLPSAQPEPISESYAKAVMTWLVQYQIKCAELQGRYTPYEVLGWIVNDWRKDNGINQ